MPTLKDIAKACNVSYSTVSRAFNPAAPVQPEVREQILAYARSVNYTPNTLAQGLKRKRTGLIGVILQFQPKMHFEYNLHMLRCYETHLKKAGFQVLTTFVGNAQEERAALQQMIGLRVEALLFQPFGERNLDLLESIRTNTALVQIGGYLIKDFDTVTPNDDQGMLCAMNHLIDKGHTRILFVAPEDDLRVKDFQSVMNDRHISYSTDQILTKWNSETDIIPYIESIRPTAIFGISQGAFSAYSALLTLKIKIPEEISFMAYDDLQWTQITKISTMTHNWTEMGEKVTKLITKRLKNYQTTGEFPTKRESLHVDLYLTERDSVIDLTHGKQKGRAL